MKHLLLFMESLLHPPHIPGLGGGICRELQGLGRPMLLLADLEQEERDFNLHELIVLLSSDTFPVARIQLSTMKFISASRKCFCERRRNSVLMWTSSPFFSPSGSFSFTFRGSQVD